MPGAPVDDVLPDTRDCRIDELIALGAPGLGLEVLLWAIYQQQPWMRLSLLYSALE
jgi:hypothetical protein